ncbi:hypothetical protein Scel_56940 [Streptomyces cellostaticus]|nr:hypothetical protein Scel_56940 [Streptomyces cellostaticus]
MGPGAAPLFSGPFSRQRFFRCPALVLLLRLRLVAHVVHGLLFRVVRFPYASYAFCAPSLKTLAPGVPFPDSGTLPGRKLRGRSPGPGTRLLRFGVEGSREVD